MHVLLISAKRIYKIFIQLIGYQSIFTAIIFNALPRFQSDNLNFVFDTNL